MQVRRTPLLRVGSRPRAAGAIALAVALVALAGGAAGCRKSEEGPARVASDIPFGEIMGTDVEIIVYAPDEDAGRRAIAAGRARLQAIDRALSTYKSDSEVTAINRAAGGQSVPISDTTARAIQAGIDASQLSGGAFNPLVGPLVHLWRQAAAKDHMPDEAELAGELKLLDIDAVELTRQGDQHFCRLAHKGMQLDLGGVAKGWSADEAIAAMRKAVPGLRAALAILGGDGTGWSDPQWTRPWTFGVQDPLHPEHRTWLRRLAALNASVVTSGNYYQYFEIGGKRYSHILDPRTGRPVETDIASATVVADNGGRADALATACMVLGTDGAIEMLERIDGAEGLILQNTPDGLRERRTSGMARYELDK